MTSFSALIEPIIPRDFWQQSLAKKEFAFFSGADDRIADVLSWPVINNALNEHRVPLDDIRVFQKGMSVGRNQYTTAQRLNVLSLTTILRDNATLILDHANEYLPSVDRLCCELQRELHARVSANIYATFGAERGFNVHWDDHDVIVLQIDGTKDWYIYGSTRPNPHRVDLPWDQTPPHEPILQRTLNPGDLVYVPRGCWHHAQTGDSHSLHITIGLYFKTGVDYVSWLADQLLSNDFCRQDVPMFTDIAAHQHYFAELQHSIAEAMTEQSYDRFLSHFDDTIPARMPANLPVLGFDDLALSESDEIKLCVDVTPSVHVADSGDTLTLRANRYELVLAAAAKTMIDLLINQRRCSMKDLIAVAPDGINDLSSITVFIGELASHGLVAKV